MQNQNAIIQNEINIHNYASNAAWWENPQLETFGYLGRMMTVFNEENIAWYQSIWDQFEDRITEVNRKLINIARQSPEKVTIGSTVAMLHLHDKFGIRQ